MKNKIIIMILIICMLTVSINPKKIKSAEVVVKVTTEVLIYLITQSIAGGVSVSDIFERRTAGDDYVTGITLKDGNTVQLPGGVTYKLRPSFTDSISKNITLPTLSELTNSVTITGNTMKVDTLSVETHNSLNSLNELIRSNPKLKSYINNDTLLGKSMNPLQFENIKSILRVFKGIDKSNYTYSYWAIFPSIKNVGQSGYDTNYYGYTLVMSNNPFFIMNRQANFTDERKSYFYTVFDYISDDWLTYSHEKFTTKNGFTDLFIPLKYDGLSNEFWDNNITVIGNGVMNLGYERWLEIANNEFGGQTLENWEAYVDDVTSQYYSLPLYTLMSLTIDTYNPYLKDNVMVKENEDIVFENISTLEDLDTYFDYVNVGAVADLENGRTIDNTDSVLRSGLIDRVIDWDKQDTIPGTGTGDTTIDLTDTNERLDKILEKLGQLVGSVEGIDALTDSQLRDILDELDLAGTDALTVEQVRELLNERDMTQEVELEMELDLKKYELDSGIINKFPFCIPFDLIKVIKKMDSTATAPRFEFPFKFSRLGINETIVLDLTQFEKVAVVVRWFVLVSYLLLLIYATRSLIKG